MHLAVRFYSVFAWLPPGSGGLTTVKSAAAQQVRFCQLLCPDYTTAAGMQSGIENQVFFAKIWLDCQA
jgi:hypothetical protein